MVVLLVLFVLYSFHGTAPEPRPSLSSGHMPHSLSLPFSSVLSESSTTEPSYKILKSPEELVKVFKETLGAEEWEKVKKGERGVTTTCGSGMTVCPSPSEHKSVALCSRRLRAIGKRLSMNLTRFLSAFGFFSCSQAAILWLALQRAGVSNNVSLYDEVSLSCPFSFSACQ